jgi:DNA repair protein RecN (Recombination protein N)
VSIVTRSKQLLAKPARIDADVDQLLKRLGSVLIELKDIGSEAGALAARVEVSPAEMERMQERMDKILRLQQKHRVKSNEELLALQNDLQARVAAMVSMDERIPGLEKEENAMREEVRSRAEELSRARTKASRELAGKVERILHELGMEHAVFQFDHKKAGEPGPMGVDLVRALFTANKERAPQPLDKVASGGELSRVMLALISLAADSQDLPTVIFDEIDTGVSGEVADRVGSMMARMSAGRQVLAITHLPQIASKAAHHLLVTKETDGDSLHSRMTMLDSKQRVEAIAQMLSGRKLTKAALENARVLLEQR